jgi:putative endonuclease
MKSMTAVKKTKPVNKKMTRTFRRSGQFHVYILECADGTFYIGYTNDLDARVTLHNKGGGSKYVRTRLPAKLVYCKPYRYYKLAMLEERRLKKLSRGQKEKIVQAFHPLKVRRLYAKQKSALRS